MKRWNAMKLSGVLLVAIALMCSSLRIDAAVQEDGCDPIDSCFECDAIKIEGELFFFDEQQGHPGPGPIEPHKPLVKLHENARFCPDDLANNPELFPQHDDQYGWSVAISSASDAQDDDVLVHGPVVVVGAPFADWPGDPQDPTDNRIENCGAVYVYQTESPRTEDSSEWTLIEKIFSPRKIENGNFGCDVGVITQSTRGNAHLPKNYIFVGQPSFSTKNPRPGAAFVFELVEAAELNDLCDNRIVHVEPIRSPHRTNGDLFGYSLDVSHMFYPSSQEHISQDPNVLVETFDNLLIAIGAPGVNKATLYSRFYRCKNNNKTFWHETVTLSSGTLNSTGDRYGFGHDVALTQNKFDSQDELAMIVGFPQDEIAYVFEGSYSQWDPRPVQKQPWDLSQCTNKVFSDMVNLDVAMLYDCWGTDNENDDHFGFSVDIHYSNGRMGGHRGVVAAVGVPDDRYCTTAGDHLKMGSARVFEKPEGQTWESVIDQCLFIRPAGFTSCQDSVNERAIEPEYWCTEGEGMNFGYSIKLASEGTTIIDEQDYLLAVGAPYDPWHEYGQVKREQRGRVYLYGRPRHASDDDGTVVDPELNDTLYQILQDYQATQDDGFVYLSYNKDNEQESAKFGTSVAINQQGYIAVGANGHGSPENRTGQVYLQTHSAILD